MIDRLLIANRGEIALRIARTAHRLGVSTVGVYSEPDANAMHVDHVDIAVALGGSTAADSYLRGERIIEIALETGADAIHPGYGFLAENADFADAVMAAGLTWVGPTPDQIRLLGDKLAAKRAAVEAGVPTTAAVPVVPGEAVGDIAMPALIKAAAGGGGRGMRIVREPAELTSAVEAASREATAAFGDGTVFIEPYLERGRHVEVQIVGDRFGAVVHLGERECSIQRRNQKIVEESPSAGIDATTREALLKGAVALARHVGYENAGTVEFLVGDDGTINFLEVNTRLQVEHPVTEAVTGLDLVELQLRVAAGEPLPLAQRDVRFDGHAIEVRVVAEDPAAGWMPSTGRLGVVDFGRDVRIDAGVAAGDTVTPYYDSLLAKVIAHGSTRSEAAGRLERCLRSAQVTGVRTNLGALAAIMREADFLAAATTTSYLDDHPSVCTTGEARPPVPLLIGAALALEGSARRGDAVTGFAPSGWRNLRTVGQRRTLVVDDNECRVEYEPNGDGLRVLVGDWPEPLDDGTLPPDGRVSHAVRLLDRRDSGRLALEVDGIRHVVETAVAHRGDGSATIETRSRLAAATFEVPARFAVPEAAFAGGGPICPLPGTVIEVLVEVDQIVGEGDVLMVIEAMKMEHKITAATHATVAEIHFNAGDRVDAGDLLVSLATE